MTPRSPQARQALLWAALFCSLSCFKDAFAYSSNRANDWKEQIVKHDTHRKEIEIHSEIHSELVTRLKKIIAKIPSSSEETFEKQKEEIRNLLKSNIANLSALEKEFGLNEQLLKAQIEQEQEQEQGQQYIKNKMNEISDKTNTISKKIWKSALDKQVEDLLDKLEKEVDTSLKVQQKLATTKAPEKVGEMPKFVTQKAKFLPFDVEPMESALTEAWKTSQNPDFDIIKQMIELFNMIKTQGTLSSAQPYVKKLWKLSEKLDKQVYSDKDINTIAEHMVIKINAEIPNPEKDKIFRETMKNLTLDYYPSYDQW